MNAVEREMDAFEQSLAQSPSGKISPKIHPSNSSPAGIFDKTAETLKKDGVSQTVEKPHSRPAIDHQQDLPSLKNDSGLKEKIHDLIRNSDHSISLKHLVKELYPKNFDGNYDPILSDLDRLEREDKIEGQVINGKVFFRMKQKTPRKYTIRKGKNFRKYFD